MQPISYARHQFPPDVIRHAVWLYLRFTLSYRDVEELLAERGLDVSYETVRRWVLKLGRGRSRRRLRAKTGPNFSTQRRTVSYETSSPRSAKSSSTSRKLRVKRRYSHTACRMTSGGNW